MKKTFTLIAAIIFMSAASFAQYNNNDGDRDDNDNQHRDVVVLNNGYDRRGDDRHFGERERNRQIEQINFEYNRKIEQVANNFLMGRHKKRYIIAELQERRENDIRFVWSKYKERRDDDNQGDKDYHNHGRRNW